MTRSQTAEHWAERLQMMGRRLTASRRAVLAALAEAGAGLSPQEILRLGRRCHRSLGLVTVYRTLDLLVECGAVRKVHCAGKCQTYALAAGGHGHHVICENCQAVMEFDDCDLNSLFQAVQRRTGYTVRAHLLELFGECPDCRRKGG